MKDLPFFFLPRRILTGHKKAMTQVGLSNVHRCLGPRKEELQQLPEGRTCRVSISNHDQHQKQKVRSNQ